MSEVLVVVGLICKGTIVRKLVEERRLSEIEKDCDISSCMKLWLYVIQRTVIGVDEASCSCYKVWVAPDRFI